MNRKREPFNVVKSPLSCGGHIASTCLCRSRSIVSGWNNPPKKIESLCEAFETPENATLYDGCPVVTQKIPSNKTKDLPKEALNRLQETADDKNLQSVKLFRMAEKAGYLKDADIQRRIMTLVGNAYLAETDLIGEVTQADAQACFEKHQEEFVLLASVLRPPKTRLEDVDAMVRARIRKERLNAVLEGK